MRSRLITIFVLVAILILPLAFARNTAASSHSDVVINEIMQNPSAVSDSAGEWFEVYNSTGSAIDIDGWTIMDDDFDSFVIDNGGPLIIPADGYLVLGNNADSSTNGGVSVDYEYLSDFPAGIFLGNGSDELVLLDSSSTEIDRVEWDNGATFPDPNGASMALIDPTLDNNVGENWCESLTPFGDGDLGTPGAATDCTAPPPPPEVTIMEIQGAGHLSPYASVEVTTTGIVTGVAFDRFYVQDPDGDDDVNTSDGMEVFMGSFCNGCPSEGDFVQLTDTVSEFVSSRRPDDLTATQMSFPSITVVSSGNPLPDPVVIGLSGRMPPNVDVISEDEVPVNLREVPGEFNPENDGIDFYESLEGMLVTVEDAVAVSAVRSFGNFSSEMFSLPNNGHPEIIEPNNARTDRGGINLDVGPDGYGDLNPERVQIQFDASDIRTGTLFPSTVPSINVGDWLGDVIGVVGYDFGNFEVRAKLIEFNSAGLEAETTSLFGTKKSVTVASYNVLNLSPLSSDDAQRAKLADQIVNSLGSPDVIALQEIQDNNGTTDDGTTDATLTMQALVDAISLAGGPDYDFFDVAPADGSSGGVPGGNIRNAFFYNSDRVELDGFVSLTPSVLGSAGVGDPNAFDGTRDPLAATFTFGGKQFTVINNHLSSRFGSTPIFGGPQLFFQAGETEREAQLQALNDYVDFLLADDKDARVIVLGDFNTFESTNDLTEILPGTVGGEKAIMKSLLGEVEDDNRYTFIFDGNSQMLDHMFATRSLLEKAEFDIVHVNVDYSRRRNDITASDHEPLVGRFTIK